MLAAGLWARLQASQQESCRGQASLLPCITPALRFAKPCAACKSLTMDLLVKDCVCVSDLCVAGAVDSPPRTVGAGTPESSHASVPVPVHSPHSPAGWPLTCASAQAAVDTRTPVLVVASYKLQCRYSAHDGSRLRCWCFSSWMGGREGSAVQGRHAAVAFLMNMVCRAGWQHGSGWGWR